MKKFLSLMILTAALTTAAFAQHKMEAKPTEKDKTEAIPSAGVLKRGAALGNAKKVSLAQNTGGTGEIHRQNSACRRRHRPLVQNGRLLDGTRSRAECQISPREIQRSQLFYSAQRCGSGGESRRRFFSQNFEQSRG